MTIGTLLRPAAPSGPIPTNQSLLDDARIETTDDAETETHRFSPDRNSTILVRASAVVQRSDGDDRYATVFRQALARQDAGGSLTFDQDTLALFDPSTQLAGIDILFAVDASLGAPDRMLVKVKGIGGISPPTLRWQVSVTITQLDQSI
jgi:hypothetical protein